MTVASFCTAALLVAALISGCNNWSGFGFNASGPEMPRLREALALKAGMVVADERNFSSVVHKPSRHALITHALLQVDRLEIR